MTASLRVVVTLACADPPMAVEFAKGAGCGSSVILQDRIVQVWLFGMLAAFAAERPLVLRLPPTATFGDAINALAQRLGGRFAEQVIQEPGKIFNHCRIFADGQEVEDLSKTFGGTGPASNFEMILLMAAEGG